MNVAKSRYISGAIVSNDKTSSRVPRLSLASIVMLVGIIICANDLFKLVPWYHIPGIFNINDVGLLLLLIAFVSYVLVQRSYLLFNNVFSILIIIYLFYCVLQVSIASFNYNQSIISGIIGVRDQIYYLAFFVFLALFDSREKIEQFIKILYYLAIFLIIAGTINHFGITIFHYKWAEGHQIRFGVMRAYIPGMVIVSMGLIWVVVGWIAKKRSNIKSGMLGLVFVYAHVLRQTRINLVAVTVVIVMLFIKKKKYKLLAAGAFSVVLAASVIEVTMEENILLAPFVTAVEDVMQGTGSWNARLQQLEVDIQVFMEHPYFGSGTSVIRLAEGVVSSGRMSEMHALAKSDDLGYAHWLKAYGIPGVIWLIVLYSMMYSYYKKIRKPRDETTEPLVLFVYGYLMFVVLSFLTLPHLMRSDLIILFAMVLAILVRLNQFNRQDISNDRPGIHKDGVSG